MNKRNITALEAAINSGDVARRLLGEDTIGEMDVGPNTDSSDSDYMAVHKRNSARNFA